MNGVRREVRYAVLGLVLLACSRTGLGLDDGELELADAAADSAIFGTDAASRTECVPSEEICNGVDDDCDGQVDELPAMPCEGGGYRFCVAGTLSECPKKCDQCMPGTERICFLSYCKYWAVQTCAADGKSFGKCREEDAPPACAEVAKDHQYSAKLEQCCLDQGYCCLDEFDLDGDGNTNEMLGNCDELSCE